MAQFFELISDFEKIRDYLRDFYIYGFKSREDFSKKSLRTYDNEKRRIESFLGDYVGWNYTPNGKSSFISVDASLVPVNPLYAVWKSKSFVANDIMLHFYILDTLRSQSPQSIVEITDHVCEQSEDIFGLQTVRNKCNRYVELGLLSAEKVGRSLEYSLSSCELEDLLPNAQALRNAISFFQGDAPFGMIGYFLLDQQRAKNEFFLYKHQFMVHSLEEEVLLSLVKAIREKRWISFVNASRKSEHIHTLRGVPMEIRVSTDTGRRYLSLWQRHRFFTYRLDAMSQVELGDVALDYEEMTQDYATIAAHMWGSSLSYHRQLETVCLKLEINPQTQPQLLERLQQEGKQGEILPLANNQFLYTIHVLDANEVSRWMKTFIGSIVQLETTNEFMYRRFFADMYRLGKLYFEEGSDDTL